MKRSVSFSKDLYDGIDLLNFHRLVMPEFQRFTRDYSMISQRLANSLEKLNGQRWRIIKQRTSMTCDDFYYGVRTTGVFCRPGCASRLPKRKNVVFFDTIDSAMFAGFRPCKRCHPESGKNKENKNPLLVAACRRLEQSEKVPKLDELAAQAGLSPRYFHRLFKEALGVTPRQYADALRASRFREQLANSRTVTDAIHETGFGSGSRAHQCANDHLGMKPSEYRKGALKMNIDYAMVETSMGWMLVAASDRGVCLVELADNREQLQQRLRSHFGNANLGEGNGDFLKLVESVVEKIEIPGKSIDFPMDIQGTAFQQRIWQQLAKIPAGHTATYTEIATKIGQPLAVRAVANACAANKLAVLIPCHRVIRADGSLGGYRWGLERKSSLLAKESLAVEGVKSPGKK